MMNGYNGWSNYETWRVNLELFDGMTAEDMGYTPTAETADDDRRFLSHMLEEYAYDMVESQSQGWAQDIAKSFLAEVEWAEIAEHMVDDYIAELV